MGLAHGLFDGSTLQLLQIERGNAMFPGLAHGEVEDYLIHLIPEPATLVMLLGGLAALLTYAWRSRQRR